MEGFGEINTKHNQIRSATVNATDLSTLFTYLYLQYNSIQFPLYSSRLLQIKFIIQNLSIYPLVILTLKMNVLLKELSRSWKTADWR